MKSRGTMGAPQNIFGIITGSVTALRFPDVPAIYAKLQTRLANSNNFYIGNAVGNTVYEMDAGEETDWFEINNLDELWYSAPSGTADHIVWWVGR